MRHDITQIRVNRAKPYGTRMRDLVRESAETASAVLTKKLFHDAYKVSDEAYWRSHAEQHEWRSLGGIIEYSPNLLAMPRDGRPPEFVILLRTTSQTALRRLTLKIKVKKSGTIVEQIIRLEHLDQVPARKALSAITAKADSSTTVGRYRLGDVYMKLVEAIDIDGIDRRNGRRIADIFPATASNSEADHDRLRWGQYWNVDLIDFEKENIRSHLYHDLVYSARKLGRPLTARRIAYRLLTSGPALNGTFWTRNLFNATGMRNPGAPAPLMSQAILTE